MSEIIDQIFEGIKSLRSWGLAGFVFGIVNVLLLIKESIWNWLFGILYVLVSFVVFWQYSLYGDFILHIFYLVLNIYGWYYWINGKKKGDIVLPITISSPKETLVLVGLTAVGIVFFGYILRSLPIIFEEIAPASLPFWDAATSIISVTGMWLTAKKKLDSWFYWLIVNILATGIYFYKEIYFYSALYFIYITMAIVGYLSWKKAYLRQIKKNS